MAAAVHGFGEEEGKKEKNMIEWSGAGSFL
jgi:hypothetical protein